MTPEQLAEADRAAAVRLDIVRLEMVAGERPASVGDLFEAVFKALATEIAKIKPEDA